jgi:trk system potassium uptake protein TrkH
LLILSQLGGIGIMGVTTILSLLVGQRLGLRERLFVAGEMGVDTPMTVLRLLKVVFGYTIILELAGALLLYVKFTAMGLPWGWSVYYSIFHSVSAFCSAGLSLFPDSLTQFRTTIIIPATTMILMLIGGLGFPVLIELMDIKQRKIKFLSPYAKIVLIATAAFTVAGTLLFTISEWNAAFSEMPLWGKLWNGLFTSISTRGGGFHTVDYSKWSAEGLMTILFFMFIGSAPSSTGGGLKITTFTVLLWAALSELKHEEEVVIFGRKIPPSTIRRALAVAFVYIITMFIATAILSKLENVDFSSLVFEVVSALGTTGLSSGVVREISTIGKIVIVLLMFWGRVGILTFSYSLVRRDKPQNVRFPEAQIPIG